MTAAVVNILWWGDSALAPWAQGPLLLGCCSLTLQAWSAVCVLFQMSWNPRMTLSLLRDASFGSGVARCWPVVSGTTWLWLSPRR